jgi:hypothetical protein
LLEAIQWADQMRGIYFLANDRVLDLAIAFLNSFRVHNPRLALCFIPFDDSIDELLRLRESYAFTVFNNRHALSQCDEISRTFHGECVGQYRKLAMWEGEFDEFIYVDVDTVVLEPLDFCFEFLAEYDFITSHSNMPKTRRWVWRDTILDTNMLQPEQMNYAANTGFIISRGGVLTFDGVVTGLLNARALMPHMELLCTEQPFLNYLIVTSGCRYSSLSAIASKGRRKNIPLGRWSHSLPGYIDKGRVIVPTTRAPVLLVHWAGEWQRGSHESNPLWTYYRHLNDRDSRLEPGI